MGSHSTHGWGPETHGWGPETHGWGPEPLTRLGATQCAPTATFSSTSVSTPVDEAKSTMLLRVKPIRFA
jgi:hypothetical protein